MCTELAPVVIVDRRTGPWARGLVPGACALVPEARALVPGARALLPGDLRTGPRGPRTGPVARGLVPRPANCPSHLETDCGRFWFMISQSWMLELSEARRFDEATVRVSQN